MGEAKVAKLVRAERKAALRLAHHLEDSATALDSRAAKLGLESVYAGNLRQAWQLISDAYLGDALPRPRPLADPAGGTVIWLEDRREPSLRA